MPSVLREPRILLVAGEASGDLHGGHLLLALRRLLPDVQAVGVGGDQLRAAGMELLADVSQLSAAGLVEIAGSIPRHWRVMRVLKQQMDQRRPDVVVLVDYPGFNQFVAKEAHRRGIPVLFYIAPQVWAWGKGRARRMAGFIDRLAVIFPFEENIFNAHGRCFAQYVGHPLLDGLKVTSGRSETRFRYGFSDQQMLLVVMPGSRPSEVRLLLPDLLQAAALLKADGWQVAMLQAPTLSKAFFEQVAGGTLPIPLIAGDTYNLLAAADAGLIASGTATLEAALLGCPPVIVYRFSWLTYLLGKLVIGRRPMGLPNVVLGRRAFPELLQREVNPAQLVHSVQQLRSKQSSSHDAIDELRVKMGPAGASRCVADLLLDLLP